MQKAILNFFIAVVLLLSFTTSFAQLKEVDEKKEFIGLTFLSLPDYSTLDFFKPGSDLNIYTLKKPRSFTTAEYSISKIYIAVQKGRVMSFLCIIDNDKDYENIVKELKNTFPIQAKEENTITYNGKNILFLSRNDQNQKSLFITTANTDTIPDVKDNSGIIDLPGKEFSDLNVAKFMASIPGKGEKKMDGVSYNMVWKDAGIVIRFLGKGKGATIYAIHYYMVLDKFSDFYGITTPCSGGFPMPYGINPNTPINQIIDKFGKMDFPQYRYNPAYSKYKIQADYEDTQSKPYDKLILIHFDVH